MPLAVDVHELGTVDPARCRRDLIGMMDLRVRARAGRVVVGFVRIERECVVKGDVVPVADVAVSVGFSKGSEALQIRA